MSAVTQIAVIETKQAIWDYDPTLEQNRVTLGGLDVIAIIRTLAVKVRFLFFPCSLSLTTHILYKIEASGQRIEAFNRRQIEEGFDRPRKLVIHGNTRWGSAHGMLKRSHELRKAWIIVTAHLCYLLTQYP